MNHLIHNPKLLPKSQAGFTLIELLVALSIGVFIIGGAIAVFMSTQMSAAAKNELDTAQEAFRFASQTISRVVRQSDSPPQISNSGNELVVPFTTGDGIRDCVGRFESGPNTFRLVGNQLRCEDTNQIEHTLVSGIDALSFALFTNESVQVFMTVNNITTSFVATSRPLIIALHSPSGGTPNNGEPGEQEPEPITCNCHFQNTNHGYTVQPGSDAQCTPSCCQSNDTGNGNNRNFTFTTNSC